MESIVQTFDSNINTILQDYVKKPTLIRGVVHLLLMLYVVRLAPQPPKPVLQLFENIYFKLFIFSLVLWTAQFSPSTSLLIALAFLVTMNYVNTGKVWEYLENVKADTVVVAEPVSVEIAVEAVKVLAEAAASPVSASPEVVNPVAEIAAAAATTQEGVDAIKVLADQAIAPSAAPAKDVVEVAQSAVQSIAPVAVEPVAAGPVAAGPVDVKQAVEAVKALAQAASSPNAVPEEDVIPVAKIAAEAAIAAGDANGLSAVKALAAQAMEPAAGKPEQVAAAAQAAIEAVVSAPVAAPVPAQGEKEAGAPTPAAQASGCYPLRKYDMTLVKPQSSGRLSYEDYQSFQATPQ